MLQKNKIPQYSDKAVVGRLKREFLDSCEQVLETGYYILGKKLEEFERKFAQFTDTEYCVGVANGLDAIFLSLTALGIGKDDEVIVPSNTFIATVLAISHVGATPVFVEPCPDTYNIDPEKIEAAITGRTKAVILVHLYGQACEINKIQPIAKRNKLFIIEDNAQAQGAECNGKKTGSFGILNCTSFYPTKNIGAFGDGGAITTDNSNYYKKILILRNYGSLKKYYNDVIGYNSRLDEMQAAFLLIKLKYLNNWNKERQRIANYYFKALEGRGDIILPVIAKECTSVYHQFVIRTRKRQELQEYLGKKGISTSIHYPVPPHLQKAYKHMGFKKGNFPIAEEIADTCLSLPIYPGLRRAEIEYITEAIQEFFS